MEFIKNAIVATFFLSISFYGFTQDIPTDVIGSWKGKVIEQGRSDWYTVELELHQGKPATIVGSVNYPDYKCGGNLYLIKVAEEDGWKVAILREKLTYGSSCINNGRVLLTRDGKRLRFQWDHPDYEHKAQGFLDSK